MGGRVVGLQLEGRGERPITALPVPVVERLGERKRGMSLRDCVVDAQGCLGCRLGLRKCLIGWQVAIEGKDAQSICQARVRKGE